MTVILECLNVLTVCIQEMRERLDFYEQQLSHAQQQGYSVECFSYSRELSTASSKEIVYLAYLGLCCLLCVVLSSPGPSVDKLDCEVNFCMYTLCTCLCVCVCYYKYNIFLTSIWACFNGIWRTRTKYYLHYLST